MAVPNNLYPYSNNSLSLSISINIYYCYILDPYNCYYICIESYIFEELATSIGTAASMGNILNSPLVGLVFLKVPKSYPSSVRSQSKYQYITLLYILDPYIDTI